MNYIASLIADADLYCEIEDQIRMLIDHKGDSGVVLPNVTVSDFWSHLAGDRSLKDDLLQATWLDANPDDPYNKAVAAYYGTGPFSVESADRHPYRKKGKKARIYRIVKPCKSLGRRLMSVFGRDRAVQ